MTESPIPDAPAAEQQAIDVAYIQSLMSDQPAGTADVPERERKTLLTPSRNDLRAIELICLLQAPEDRAGMRSDLWDRVKSMRLLNRSNAEVRRELLFVFLEAFVPALGRIALKVVKWAGVLAAAELVKELAKKITGGH